MFWVSFSHHFHSVWRSHFSNSFRSVLLAVNSLGLLSLDNVFNSHLYVLYPYKKDIFAGYRNLGLCFISFHVILAISFCSHSNRSHIRNVDFPGCSQDSYLVLCYFLVVSLWCAWVWVSLYLSCMGFIELFESVGLWVLQNLRSFLPLFLEILFLTHILSLFLLRLCWYAL